MNYFSNPKNIAELKAQYKALVKKYHPDLGGSDQEMAEINNQYEELFKRLPKTEREEKHETFNDEWRDILVKIIKLEDLTIDIIGSWLWVSGKGTFNAKDVLKAEGFKPIKKEGIFYWVFSPEGVERQGKHYKKQSQDAIKMKYGCQSFESEGALKLEGKTETTKKKRTTKKR